MKQNTIVEVSHLSKRFGTQLAINDLSFEVYEGEFLSILGPSGGGKSTLLNLIAGLLAPDAGNIRIKGDIVSSPHLLVAPEKRSVNMIFQNYALWPHMNVYDHISFGFKKYIRSRELRDEKVQELLQLLELQGLEKRLP